PDGGADGGEVPLLQELVQVILQNVQLFLVGDEVLGAAAALPLVLDGGGDQVPLGGVEGGGGKPPVGGRVEPPLALIADIGGELGEVRQAEVVEGDHVEHLPGPAGVLEGGVADPALA